LQVISIAHHKAHRMHTRHSGRRLRSSLPEWNCGRKVAQVAEIACPVRCVYVYVCVGGGGDKRVFVGAPAEQRRARLHGARTESAVRRHGTFNTPTEREREREREIMGEGREKEYERSETAIDREQRRK